MIKLKVVFFSFKFQICKQPQIKNSNVSRFPKCLFHSVIYYIKLFSPVSVSNYQVYIYMSKKIWKLSLFMEEMIQGRGKTGKETRQVNTTEVHKYHSMPK